MSETNWNLVAVLADRYNCGPRPSGQWTWRMVGHLERLLAASILLVLSPALLLVALAIRWSSNRAPLVAHLRVGQYGQPLWMLKFRTMWGDRPAAPSNGLVERISDDSGPARKSAADPRVRSAFARFCRRFSIDELPQLIHVARGEMSLVGPRPITARELETYYDGCMDEVLLVKPGLSGLWQVMGRNRLTYEERRAYDLLYVRNRSLRFYLKILLSTPREVLCGKNSF